MKLKHSKTNEAPRSRTFTRAAIKKDWKHNKMLFLLLLPMIVYVILFNYIPMTGLLMAFEDFKLAKGVFGSPWVGLNNFRDFFSSVYFGRSLRNTLLISIKDIIVGFPAPIIFAILFNEIAGKKFKKVVSTMSYMPYFISTVVIAGLVHDFCGSGGIITNLLNFFGYEGSSMMVDPDMFHGILVGSNLWQSLGFSSILYIAALSGIDQELYEAAWVDGATRWQQMIHITIPGIANTIIIMFILRMGSLLSVNFEKIILLYNSSTMDKADVISSYVYRVGLEQGNYGYSTAVGLFNSVIGLILIIVTNAISKKYSETSLF